MVQFQNVTKKFENGFVAVKDISFMINEGEFVFLIGPSGSGKTTLIELLIRDHKPSAGKIFINDQDITHISRSQVYKLRRQIGVIFQDFKLIPDQTAYENVSFAMEAAGKTNKEIKETVPYVLDIVGLGSKMKYFPKQLSGGEQQRVAIARAISNNPKVLIADEPTGNLDPASAWDIVQILAKINNWGTTVIMSTHGTEIVNTLNKRVIQMENGIVSRDDNEGQYEFMKQADPKVIEDVYEDEESKPRKSFKVRFGKDFKIKKGDKKDEDKKEEKEADIDSIGNATDEDAKQVLSEKSKDPTDSIHNDGMENRKSALVNPVAEKQEPNIEEVKEKKSLFTALDKVAASFNLAGMIGGEEKKEEVGPEKVESEEGFVDQVEKDFLKKFGDTSVDYLNLPKPVIKDLQTAGYKTIGEILEDGPENLSKKKIIDPEEVIMVAQAIEKLAS